MRSRQLPEPGTLTPKRLGRLVSLGESDRIEYKSARTSEAQLIDAAVCFANGNGGLILWGVNDDGTYSGVSRRDPASLTKTIFHSTSPSQLVESQVIAAGEGVSVLAMWVQHSPVLVSTTGSSYLQRVGTECVPMTPDRLIVRQIDTHALDVSAALTPIGLDGIDELEVQRYRQTLPADDAGERLRQSDTPALLASIGAIREHGRGLALTVAGLLIFGREEEIRATLPQHQLVYLRTPAGSTDYERRLVTSSPILRMLDQISIEITAASITRTMRIGPRDIEVPDYPERVLREAIVNALAHRHYTLPGDTVIRQTRSSLEIENPGGFPEGISAGSVIQHAPVHRNRLLCDILDRIRLMERSGLGVDRIYEDQIRFGKVPPTYEADRTTVRLRLDAQAFDEPFARFVHAEEQANRRWRVEDLLILSHLRRMGPTDRETLSSVIQRPEPEAQDVIAQMSPDLIERYGVGAGIRLALSARVQAALGAAGAYTRERGLARSAQHDLILQHARQFGRVDNKTVRQILQISRMEATNQLRALEHRGLLVMHGSRRWAYYEAVDQQRLPM